MVNCPHCGAPATDSAVWRTYTSKKGVERQRHCWECGKNYRTVEVIERDYHVMQFIGYTRRIIAGGGNGER